MKRGSVVRLSHKVHSLEVAGSNPAPASIVLSPLGCTEHKSEGRTSRLFWASFDRKSLVYGLLKPLVFAMKTMHVTEPETCALKHSVWTGSCIS